MGVCGWCKLDRGAVGKWAWLLCGGRGLKGVFEKWAGLRGLIGGATAGGGAKDVGVVTSGGVAFSGRGFMGSARVGGVTGESGGGFEVEAGLVFQWAWLL